MSSRYSVPCAVAVPIASVATDAIAKVAVRTLMFTLMLDMMVKGTGMVNGQRVMIVHI